MRREACKFIRAKRLAEGKLHLRLEESFEQGEDFDRARYYTWIAGSERPGAANT